MQPPLLSHAATCIIDNQQNIVLHRLVWHLQSLQPFYKHKPYCLHHLPDAHSKTTTCISFSSVTVLKPAGFVTCLLNTENITTKKTRFSTKVIEMLYSLKLLRQPDLRRKLCYSSTNKSYFPTVIPIQIGIESCTTWTLYLNAVFIAVNSFHFSSLCLTI